MAKVHLICGKLASGKSYYSERLRKANNAVVLSCDEIMLAVFGLDAGEKHDEIAESIQNYLFCKSLEIIETGTDVILDFGFWQKEKRTIARRFFNSYGVDTQLHYIYVSDEQWKTNIEKRNKAIENGYDKAYYVDDGLLQKMKTLFEEPEKEETDIWYINEQI